VTEWSWEDADSVCISSIYRLLLWQSVVTLAVTGNTISGHVVWRQMDCGCLREHRLSLTRSGWGTYGD
jgi:hypothetical protein